MHNEPATASRLHHTRTLRRLTMPYVSRRVLVRYGLAMLCVSVAVLAHLLLGPKWILTESLFVLFLVTAILSAWYGGRGPRLLATALSAIALNYLTLNEGAVSNLLQDNVILFLFVAAGVLISLLGGMLQQSESRNVAIMRSTIDGVITLDLDGR